MYTGTYIIIIFALRPSHSCFLTNQNSSARSTSLTQYSSTHHSDNIMNMLLLVFVLSLIQTEARVCSRDPLNERVIFSCRERCCGMARQCLPSCLNVTCDTSKDCDGLTCCHNKCQKSSYCPSKKTPLIIWLSAWLSCVALVVAVLFVFCWCLKKKRGPLDPTINTEISDAFLEKDSRTVSLTTVVTWTSKDSVLA